MPRLPALRTIALSSLVFVATPGSGAEDFLAGCWGEARLDPLLEKTLRLHLAPDTSALSAGERAAVAKLLEVGAIFQDLYEHSRHAEARRARELLARAHATAADPVRTRKLLDVYRLMRGPIATTLDNRREPFLPVAAEVPGKNVYPAGLDRQRFDRFLDAHPGRRDELLHLRSIVRRATGDDVAADLAVLEARPELDVLHPGLRARLQAARDDPGAVQFYAVPYSVAYPEELRRAFDLLNEAAAAVDAEDRAFARFLRQRARDLLVDDYDGGDAAWVTGDFTGNLNAQIGSYETYDDALYGVKSFFSLSLLLRDRQRSRELAEAIGGIQAIQDALPYAGDRKVREDIPVGVYQVLADFGQARGTNTATILPNESHLARQYGRTILIRGNILMNPRIFDISRASFEAAMHPAHHADLAPEGSFYRTLWHEIGHYLGADRTADGRELGAALQDTADLLEEMKSDLVSLFSARLLHERGLFDEARLRAVYADGILRVLQKRRPRRGQPYETMQLMQWNWFLARELLAFDAETGTLRQRPDQYHDVVTELLHEVLALQAAGDRDRAEAFVQRWTGWDENLHERIAARMRAQERYRYRLVTYEALGERPGS